MKCWFLYEPIHELWVGKLGCFTDNKRNAKKFTYKEAYQIQYGSEVALVFRRAD